MHNTQPPQQADDSAILRVHSIWPTLQGEGPYAGRRAVFVRLAGCNLKCPYCDTDYTSKDTLYDLEREGGGVWVTPGDPEKLLTAICGACPIRNQFSMTTKQLVVITGGEPFRQAALVPLVELLVANGFLVQIETNGTLWLPIHKAATVVCSPKTPRIDRLLAQRANAYKYVLDAEHIDPSDGLPAGTLGKFTRTARPPEGWVGEIFVQPLDSSDPVAREADLAVCIQSAMRYGYRLCLQVHKLVGLA